MSLRKIIHSFDQWRRSREPIVLATVFETAGSTYSKAGHRMLIAANGDYQGLVSGGCLEGDLAERARTVVDSGTAVAVSYDLRDEADELFGLGIGCDGLIRILLQRLDAARNYEPFRSLRDLSISRVRAVASTVVDTVDPAVELGTTQIWQHGASAAGTFRIDGELEICDRVASTSIAELHRSDAGLAILYAPVKPVPRLLVLGAGLDAIPVVRIAAEIGFRVAIADHRPSYVERDGFADADELKLVNPAQLHQQIDLTEFDAVLVMSHHLTTDKIYLAQFADAPPAYLGVLGPPARRERVLSELGEIGEKLRPVLRGPVGLDIGADSPEAIALSIAAELYVELTSHCQRG